MDNGYGCIYASRGPDSTGIKKCLVLIFLNTIIELNFSIVSISCSKSPV